MNRGQRRHTAKILGLDNAARDAELANACQLCAFIKVQIVGAREQLYRDQQGRLIELGVNHRLEPPYGLRWPFDLQRRPPCPKCKGGGQVEVINLQLKTRTRSMCQDCLGLGKTLRGDEFAPLCQGCAQWVMSWLEARAKAHAEKFLTAGGRLVVASAADLTAMLTHRQQAAGAASARTGLARIALGGMNR